MMDTLGPASSGSGEQGTGGGKGDEHYAVSRSCRCSLVDYSLHELKGGLFNQQWVIEWQSEELEGGRAR